MNNTLLIFNVIQCLDRAGLIYRYNLLFNMQCSYSIINRSSNLEYCSFIKVGNLKKHQLVQLNNIMLYQIVMYFICMPLIYM